jgi:hypothetical protein
MGVGNAETDVALLRARGCAVGVASSEALRTADSDLSSAGRAGSSVI